MAKGILVINAGSSSIKFAGYRDTGGADPDLLCKGQVEGLRTAPGFTCADAHGNPLGEWKETSPRTIRLLSLGLVLLVVSGCLAGYGPTLG